MKTLLGVAICCSAMAQGLDSKQTVTYKALKAQLDAVPAIDTHDHLWPFETLPGYVETERGHGMNLSSIWRNSYYSWFNPISKWPPGGKFDDWWRKAKNDFAMRAPRLFIVTNYQPSRTSTVSTSRP